MAQVKFHQTKSAFFRVIHADGIWGSVHPTDLVHLTFYNERAPIAREVVHDLTDANQLSGEDLSKRVSKDGYVREMEVDVILSRPVAMSLHTWLGQYLGGTLPTIPVK